MGFNRHIRVVFWGLIIGLCAGCKQSESPLLHKEPRVLGHGGMGIYHTFPMNSMESLLLSLSYPVDGTELDVQMTRDSVLVLFHDRSMRPSTGYEGVIANNDWKDIQDLYYRFPAHAQYRLARLDAFLNRWNNADSLFLYLDVKLFHGDQFYDSYRDRFVRTLYRTLESSKMDLSRIGVESGDSFFLNRFRRLAPASSFYYKGALNRALEGALQNQYRGIVLSVEGLQRADIEAIQQQGLEVVGFNVHTRSRHRKALELGIDVIQSDNIPFMLRLLER